MLFALRQRQMRPLRTWRLEDAFSVSLSAMVTMTLCLCVHEYVSCVSVRAITPRGRGRELLSLLGMLPGGGTAATRRYVGRICVDPICADVNV
jgi:hypothetical protein